MSLINKIFNALRKEDFYQVTIKIYSDKEIVIFLYETELPIIIDMEKGYCYLDTEMNSVNITEDMMKEVYDVMYIINRSFDEINQWVSDKELN